MEVQASQFIVLLYIDLLQHAEADQAQGLGGRDSSWVGL